MIACGNKDGNITIFQIPKTHPDTLPESLKPKQKQVFLCYIFTIYVYDL